MMRLSRLTEYGIMLMRHFAAAPECTYTAAKVRAGTHLPQATVSKILRRLARGGLLLSQRGAKGGYTLARAPEEISVAGIIQALEGPFALTACTPDVAGDCRHEPLCAVRGPLQEINFAIRNALASVSVSDLAAASAPGESSAVRPPVRN